jgi:hypothetical protein
MKLRIKGNSLRLRESRSEGTRLLKGERVEETIHFTSQVIPKLTYALERESSVVAPTVRYIEAKLRSAYLPIRQLPRAYRSSQYCREGQPRAPGVARSCD